MAALKVASRECSLVPHERSLAPSRTFSRSLANVLSLPRERSLAPSRTFSRSLANVLSLPRERSLVPCERPLANVSSDPRGRISLARECKLLVLAQFKCQQNSVRV